MLFVCSGNICRSPMAAEYLRHRAGLEGLGRLVVDSAGTLGIEGARASDEAVAVLAAEGIDLTAHRSRGLTAADIRAADLIVVMTVEHLEELDRRFPAGSARRELIRAFESGIEPRRGAPDLDDPIGREREVYEDCFRTIRRCVDHLLLHLKHHR